MRIKQLNIKMSKIKIKQLEGKEQKIKLKICTYSKIPYLVNTWQQASLPKYSFPTIK